MDNYHILTRESEPYRFSDEIFFLACINEWRNLLIKLGVGRISTNLLPCCLFLFNGIVLGEEGMKIRQHFVWISSRVFLRIYEEDQ